MLTTNIYNNPVELVFHRAASKKEKLGGINRRRGFNSMPELEGYNKVYMPYGFCGAGYYYEKLITVE